MPNEFLMNMSSYLYRPVLKSIFVSIHQAFYIHPGH